MRFDSSPTTIAAKLMPQDKALALDFAAVFESQPNLPAWLASLDEVAPYARRGLLQDAAHILRTELPDHLAAQVLLRLAEDSELLTALIVALKA